MIFEYQPRQTPIDAAEAEALIPQLKTQGELNEWEEENILSAANWALSDRALKRTDPLTEDYLFELHRRMFDHTWRWAGKTRTTDKNIGVSFYKIRTELRQLLDDVRYWRENKTFEPDEAAMRFHHRLVTIHLFPNGNGRHSRLATDVFARTLGKPIFTWGGANLVSQKDARAHYLAALKSADDGDYGPLLKFGRE